MHLSSSGTEGTPSHPRRAGVSEGKSRQGSPLSAWSSEHRMPLRPMEHSVCLAASCVYLETCPHQFRNVLAPSCRPAGWLPHYHWSSTESGSSSLALNLSQSGFLWQPQPLGHRSLVRRSLYAGLRAVLRDTGLFLPESIHFPCLESSRAPDLKGQSLRHMSPGHLIVSKHHSLPPAAPQPSLQLSGWTWA